MRKPLTKLLRRYKNSPRNYARVIGINDKDFVWTNGYWLLYSAAMRDKEISDMVTLKDLELNTVSGCHADYLEPYPSLDRPSVRYPHYKGCLGHEPITKITVNAQYLLEAIESLKGLGKTEFVTLSIGKDEIHASLEDYRAVVIATVRD